MKIREREYQPPSTFNKIMLIYVLVLTFLLAALCILDRVGYSLIQSDLVLSGSGLLLLSMIAWGLIALVMKIKNRTVKIFAGFGVFALIFTVATVGMVMISYFAGMWMPSKYSIITSDSGKNVVVMKLLDTGLYDDDYGVAAEQRMLERREYILSQPDAEPVADDEMPSAAYGYVYRAYPRVFGIFYNAKADCQGAIYRGVKSESTMRYEWREDGSLRLYLEGAEVGDSGEIILN